MNARINTQKLSSTVKAIVVSNKLDGVTGQITDTFSNQSGNRVQLTFTHNNIGEAVSQQFWFDDDAVTVVKPLSQKTWLDN